MEADINVFNLNKLMGHGSHKWLFKVQSRKKSNLSADIVRMGGDPPPPYDSTDTRGVLFILNTRITKSCGLNGGGGRAVLSTLVKNSWCGQSSKGPRGQTSLGVCWVKSQARVEQVSSNFGCAAVTIYSSDIILASIYKKWLFTHHTLP